ncbi:lytic murein transglycosylase [Mesorhizobium sp. M2C.T.Ca.TU.009.01.2.1]|nr:lytic murein transglycosylase [Mesorhizobium sp. M2C.T.Ca.TU.002.02.1.1]RUU55875.1 lytic murein transglycosylase [Mesorhizobium sp. M2C.T.Ca.TU.009.01.2.1]
MERFERGPPLCPAGHLPLKGGDWMSPRLSPIANVYDWVPSAKLLISPLEGEMPGRAERGASR